MKNLTVATIAAGALVAITTGLAAPAIAAPAGSNSDQNTVSSVDNYGYYPRVS
jgi:hypothetical protein